MCAQNTAAQNSVTMKRITCPFSPPFYYDPPPCCQYFMKNLLRKFVFFFVFGAFLAQMYQKMRYIFYFCASYAPRKGRRKKFRTRYVQWVLQRRFACLREKTPQRYAAFTWRGKPMRRLKTSIGMLCFAKRCPFGNDNMRATAAKVCVWGGTAGQKRRKKCDVGAKKRNRVRLLKTRASQGCNKKTFRRALSFDLTGKIAYNLCITTCGVCRKNKGVTVC